MSNEHHPSSSPASNLYNQPTMTRIRSSQTTLNLVWLLVLSALSYTVSWSPSFWRTKQRTITFPSNQDDSEIHEYFMKLALEEASEAGKVGEVPIGAILVQQQKEVSRRRLSLSRTGTSNSTTTFRILARAGNRVESHYDASAHAELQVLRKGAKRSKNWRLPNTTLYSTLEPCPMCLAACQAFRLPTLVYGAPDLRLGAVETHLRLLDIKHPFHNVSSVIKDVCKDESAGLLRSFFKRRRKGQGKQRSWRLRLLGSVEK